jgi:hypothetical protein
MLTSWTTQIFIMHLFIIITLPMPKLFYVAQQCNIRFLIACCEYVTELPSKQCTKNPKSMNEITVVIQFTE